MCPFARSLINDIFPSGIQHFVIFAAQPYGLPLKEVTIAQYLKALGYKTHAVGKVVIMTIILKCFDCNAYENQCNFQLSSYIYFSLHKTRHLVLSLSSEIFQKLLWVSLWAIFECNINKKLCWRPRFPFMALDPGASPLDSLLLFSWARWKLKQWKMIVRTEEPEPSYY